LRQATLLHSCADSKGKGNAHLRQDSLAAAACHHLVSQGMAEVGVQRMQDRQPSQYSGCPDVSNKKLRVPSILQYGADNGDWCHLWCSTFEQLCPIEPNTYKD
jgi:hypothetical protein